MSKKNIFNVVLLVITYFLPLYFLYIEQEVTIAEEAVGVSFLFIGAFLLTYFNNKYRKEVMNYKWLWITFEIIGILGLCYSIFVLLVLFAVRHCCSF